MTNEMTRYIQNEIMTEAMRLTYSVADVAPSTEIELFNSTSLVVWSGASDNTIFKRPAVNHAFRALHDALHLKTRLQFTPDAEIELGRIQANQYSSGLMQDLIYIEIAEQSRYFKQNGLFVADQTGFTLSHLNKMGWTK